MAFNPVYIGKKNDLALYDDIDIIGYTFTVLDSDGNAYSFTGYSDINLTIYTDSTRDTVSKTIVTGDFSITTNVITWSSDWSADIALTKGLFFYDLIYEDSTNRPIMVTFGNLKII